MLGGIILDGPFHLSGCKLRILTSVGFTFRRRQLTGPFMGSITVLSHATHVNFAKFGGGEASMFTG